jgi:predicted CoA-substrate-specific enzyme activase
MIGYICKYTPIEILEGFSERAVLIEPSVNTFCCANSLMHPNICSFARAVLEESLEKGIRRIVLTNCCDSIRRLYDVLRSDNRFEFVELLDLPRKRSTDSVTFYENEIRAFSRRCERFFKLPFDEKRFFESIADACSDTVCAGNTIGNPKTISLALAGGRMQTAVKEWLKTYPISIDADLTCSNPKRASIFPKNIETMLQYTESLLGQSPCMRMNDVDTRYENLLQNGRIDGLIYQTVKFCDFYGYDYAKWRKQFGVPVLKIETDYTLGSQGQLKTRFEAFLESITAKLPDHFCTKEKPHWEKQVFEVKEVQTNKRIVAGIDAGSTSVNAVIMDAQRNVLSSSVVKTGSKSGLGAQNALDTALEAAKIGRDDISYTVSTGYGREVVSFGNETVTEITCHARGARFLDPTVRTIIDIGGQDSKVIRLGENGEVKEFVMNDKCAAGTGKFLELMAKTLELDIDQLGELAEKSNEQVFISSMCTVFAESEVISLIAQNKETPDIIKGLCQSVATRTAALVSRLGKEEKIIMTGGVAKNKGVVKSLCEKLQTSIYVPPEPQIVGAIGAALIALDRINNR